MDGCIGFFSFTDNDNWRCKIEEHTVENYMAFCFLSRKFLGFETPAVEKIDLMVVFLLGIY